MREFIFQPLCGFQPYEQLLEGTVNQELVTVFGMSEEQKNHLAAALCRSTGKTALESLRSDYAAMQQQRDDARLAV